MDLRNLTLLAIKLLGLYLLFMAIVYLAGNAQFLFFTGNDSGSMFPPFTLFMPPITYAIIGVILFRASGKIANCVIHIEKGASPSLTVYSLLSVAIRIVCLYFIFNALYSLVYHSAGMFLFHVKTILTYDSYRFYDEISLLAAGVQFAAALAGWFYAEKIVEITKKISKDE